MELSSVQVNYLVYRYLRESGFLHSSYTFRYESQLNNSNEVYNVEPGRLIRLLQRGLLYLDAESKIEKILSYSDSLVDPQVSVDSKEKPLSLIQSLKVSEDITNFQQKQLISASIEENQKPLGISPQFSNSKEEPSVPLNQNNIESQKAKPLPSKHKEDSSARDTKVSNKVTSPKKQANEYIDPTLDTTDTTLILNKTNKKTIDDTKNEEEEPLLPIDILNNDAEFDKSQYQKRIGDQDMSIKARIKTDFEDLSKADSNIGREVNDSGVMDIDLVGTYNDKSSSLKRNEYPQQPKEHSKKKKPKMFGQVTSLHGHSKSAFVNAWNPAIPNILASGAGDGTAIIWTLKTNEDTNQFENLSESKQTILNHSPEPPLDNTTPKSSEPQTSLDVTTLSWSKDGTMLATGCFDGRARIWTLDGELYKTLDTHGAPIIAVKWSPSSKYLLTGSLDGTVIVWDTQSGKTISKFVAHQGSILDVAWNNDTIFATCSTDRSISIWSVLYPLKPLYNLIGHKGEINTIAWHSSGKYLASGSDDSSAKVWEFVNLDRLNSEINGSLVSKDIENNVETVIINNSSEESESQENADVRVQTLLGHEQQVYVVEWLPNVENAILATGSFDGSVRVWDAKTGEIIRTLYAHNDPIHAIAFSPDGRQLITGSFDCFVNLWSLKNGLLIRSFMADDGIYDVGFSSAGRIAASVANGSIVVLDSKA